MAETKEAEAALVGGFGLVEEGEFEDGVEAGFNEVGGIEGRELGFGEGLDTASGGAEEGFGGRFGAGKA